MRKLRALCRLGLTLVACLMLPACVYRDLDRVDQEGRPTAPPGFLRLPGIRLSEAPAEPQTPLALDLQTAVLLALENNTSLNIERLQPGIRRTSEDLQRAAFDPLVSASLAVGLSRDDREIEGAPDITTDTRSVTGKAGAKQVLPSGTTIELDAAHELSTIGSDADIRSRVMNLDITVTQALLRGRGSDVNLARLRQARIDTRISLYELQGVAEALVAQVERAYWDYVAAERSLAIFEKSLEVAEQQVTEVKERISVGKVPETELTSAEAEVASRREQLIEARGTLAKQRLALIRLLNPRDLDTAWSRPLQMTDAAELPDITLDEVNAHVALALQRRPDLSQAKLQIERGELEIVRTRNGILPKLDVFASLGGSRYANTFSAGDDDRGDETAYAAGISFEMPLGNRDAKARHELAKLTLAQSQAALTNMEQLVQVDVRSAYVDVGTTREKIRATRATRELREKILSIERDRFQVGKSTAFLVTRAQRDLLASQIAEIEAIVNYRKALLNLYRLEGSLLTRRGIQTLDRPAK